MRYIDRAVGSVLAPKLLGTYEHELREVIEEIVKTCPDHIIDIGAAEGYYAVGLAWRISGARVTAFETSEEGQQMCRTLAALNHVSDRITIGGKCAADDLANAMTGIGRVTVICDAEGAEREILDPYRVAALNTACVLVETHEFIDPAIANLIFARFEKTHDILVLMSRPVTIENIPAVPDLTVRQRRRVASEMRPSLMRWLWMKPKAQS
jgi:hypothetical protein